MTNINILELKDKDQVDSQFLVKEKTVAIGKNGRPFMVLQIGNSTGTLDARLWDNVEEVSKEFQAGEIIQIKGLIQIYQNKRQLVIHKIQTLDQKNLQFDDFLPKASRAPDDILAELTAIVKTIKNDHIRQLIIDTFDDNEIRPLLLKAPAAKSIHHAWIGGLLEHILSIVKIMDFMSAHYPFLNRDLLIFGGIFHDIGKVWELSVDAGIQYTDRGRLIGHMEMACELIDKKSNRIMGFTQELRDVLKHIVLSHHGKLEYGSPKRPKFLEAMLVAMIDELDSKVSTVNSIITNERANPDRWSRYHEMFDRYFLLDDMKEKF